jgi:glycosyltransferase involved in cell wall biosynthesis
MEAVCGCRDQKATEAIMTPLVTVIVPVKNAETYIGAAVRSVLEQSYRNIEVIVIDDGCTDRSIEVVRGVGDPRVRIIEGPQSGISAAQNAGIAAATGEYFANCDADDLMPPDRLEWQVEFLTLHPDFGAVCGYYTAIDSGGKHVSELAQDNSPAEITSELRSGKTRTSLCAFLARMDLVRALNGMRTYFVTGQDIDFELRLGEKTRVWYEPRNTYFYRLHDKSITHTQTNQRNVFFEAKAREFQKERLRGEADQLDRGCPETPPVQVAGLARSVGKQVQGFLTAKAWKAYEDGRRREAIRYGFQALSAHPWSFAPWRNTAVLFVKCALVPSKRVS